MYFLINLVYFSDGFRINGAMFQYDANLSYSFKILLDLCLNKERIFIKVQIEKSFSLNSTI